MRPPHDHTGAVMTPDSPIMRLADGSLWVSYYDDLFRVIDGMMHVREHYTRRSRFRPLRQMDN